MAEVRELIMLAKRRGFDWTPCPECSQQFVVQFPGGLHCINCRWEATK